MRLLRKLNIYYGIGLLLSLNACHLHKQKVPLVRQMQTYTILPSVADSVDALPFLASYRMQVNSKMNVVVGNNLEELTKEKPNSTLGNMVSDAMYLEAKKINPQVVASVANYGGLRIPYLGKGAITLGKIYELMPFENTLYNIELSGSLVDTLCQYIAKGGGWPISNMEFTMKNNKASNIIINKEALNYNKKYTIAFNSYMAEGGDKCDFLIPLPKQMSGILVRDAILNYIKTCSQNKQSLIIQPINRIQ